VNSGARLRGTPAEGGFGLAVDLRTTCAERGDAQPPAREGCWLSKGQRLFEEDGVRVTTAFNRMLRLPAVTDFSFCAEGVCRSGSGAAGLLGVRPARRRPARPPGQALAPPQPRRLPLHDRVPPAARLVPRLRRPPRGGAMGQAGLGVYARLRGPGRLPRPADGQDADRPAAADLAGDGRADRRTRLGRPRGRGSPAGACSRSASTRSAIAGVSAT
jgi:hypothetical protein